MMTADEVKYLKKLRDHKFYLENLCQIKTKTKGFQPFILKQAQIDLFNTMRKHSKIMILKSRQLGMCLDKNTRILSHDLKWIKLSDVKIGQKIVSVEEYPKKGRGFGRKMRIAIVEKKIFVYEDAFKIKLENNIEIIATKEHKFLSKKWEKHTDLCWKPVKEMEVGTSIRYITKPWEGMTYEDGWMSGMIDGEGSLAKKNRKGASINVSQVPGKVWNRLNEYLSSRKYNYRVNWDTRDPSKNYSSKLGSKPVGKVIVSRMNELFRLIGQTRPSRFKGKDWWEGKDLPGKKSGDAWTKIISIENIGKREMIDLQTSEKTFIAEGLVSHNSTAVAGFLYVDTIMRPGITSALVGYNSDMVVELFDKIKTFHNTTPKELRPTIYLDSKNEMSFPAMGSKIIVLPCTKNVGRSYTLQNVLVTELAMWDDAETKMNGLSESVPPGGRIIIESCVGENTLVLTDKGLRRIKNIHDWNNNKKGFSKGKSIKLDGHYGLQETSTYYNSGIQKGFKIITKHGYELEMSSIHPVYILKNGELKFVKSKNLVVGDKIAMKYGQELWGDNDKVDWTPTPYGFNKKWIKQFNVKKITKDLAYLIGVIIGDGHVDFKRGRVCITNSDKEIINFLLNNKLGLKFYKKDRECCSIINCKNSSFTEFLKEVIGIEKATARYKKIPDVILSWSRENIVALLQGLFDTDGCCRKDRGTVSFVSTSKQIIYTLQYLLLNFGIVSNVYSRNSKPSKKVKVWSSGYSLEIGRVYSNIFLEKIGFRIKRKQNSKKNIDNNHNSLNKIIPCIGKIIKKDMKILGLKYFDFVGGLSKGLYSDSGNMTYRTVSKILKKCRNKESIKYKKLKKLFDYEYFYDEIKEIIPIKEKVYDFTIEKGHTFISNGFISHNTPNGIGDLYHRMWMQENEYVKKQYDWWWEYTEEEMAIKRKEKGDLLFDQEYGCKFLSSGRNVFDVNMLEKHRVNILKIGDINKAIEKGQKDFKVVEEDGWIIYREPKEKGIYVIGGDPSEGVRGGDPSVAVVFDRTTGEEVAMLEGIRPPDIFGEMLNKMGRIYNNALMVVEVNNHGLVTSMTLKKLIYPNLYFRPSKYETIGTGTTDRLGWRTTPITRPILINELASAIRNNEITIHSKKTLDEMLSFIYDDNGNMKPSSRGLHDDAIFATGIALQGFKNISTMQPTQLDYKQILPQNFAY